MKRVIKADERILWREAMRGVRAARAISKPPEDEKTPSVPKPRAKPVFVNSAKTKSKGPPKLPHVLDGETASRLKSRTTRPQARLDLHGRTETAAHTALTAFIEQSAKAGHFLVLVITGKGLHGDGILRRNLPLWLEAPALRPFVIAIAPAFAIDGGDGAFYVQLRRRTR